MPDKFTVLTPELHDYVVEHGARRDEVLRELAAETAELGGIAIMQISPEQGAFMTLLVRAMGARRALELGTFTGYSAICIARGLPGDGELVSCDVNEEWAGIARRHFDRAGLAERIDLRLGPALDTLRAMPATDPFDFAFIDADKVGYLDYYEETLRLLRPGGLAMIDNVLRGGRVVQPDHDDEGDRVVLELNRRIAADERVDVAMLGVSDGITLALKRPE
jgi:caffeoyl-CoA O-methyltransferase